mmetsp:Transcript_19405/g.48931  ORF Transcript_19405/g.48931 Transcript_19405/m.48931 type:complete len:351 (+) Transcript_19405:275-1327(+)
MALLCLRIGVVGSGGRFGRQVHNRRRRHGAGRHRDVRRRWHRRRRERRRWLHLARGRRRRARGVADLRKARHRGLLQLRHGGRELGGAHRLEDGAGEDFERGGHCGVGAPPGPRVDRLCLGVVRRDERLHRRLAPAGGGGSLGGGGRLARHAAHTGLQLAVAQRAAVQMQQQPLRGRHGARRARRGGRRLEPRQRVHRRVAEQRLLVAHRRGGRHVQRQPLRARRAQPLDAPCRRLRVHRYDLLLLFPAGPRRLAERADGRRGSPRRAGGGDARHGVVRLDGLGRRLDFARDLPLPDLGRHTRRIHHLTHHALARLERARDGGDGERALQHARARRQVAEVPGKRDRQVP